LYTGYHELSPLAETPIHPYSGKQNRPDLREDPYFLKRKKTKKKSFFPNFLETVRLTKIQGIKRCSASM